MKTSEETIAVDAKRVNNQVVFDAVVLSFFDRQVVSE